MTTPRLASLLLLSTSLITPAAAWAQDSTPPSTTDESTAAPATDQVDDSQTPEDDSTAPEISIPGGEIIVTGKRDRNVMRSAPQVISVLSTEQIARTGEGDIAGALGRVTGLSVVGGGYVYVRGLGDRYSLALLNGSALPSPEPLKRVVPLDLFPTSLVASSLVQKSYSVNFPGEFGGGVINLTTQAIPAESFITIGAGISADTETTGQLGYTYYGSGSDWTGYDNGNRDLSPAMKSYLKSGTLLTGSDDLSKQLGGSIVNGRNGVVQSIDDVQPNWSASLSAGTSFDTGGSTLGLIAAAGYSNEWQTRDITQQRVQGVDATQLFDNHRAVNTNQRIIANALLGAGLEFGEHQIRWTNVYIHDTLKYAALKLGTHGVGSTTDEMIQNTAWYERQLFNTQIVGEFKPAPDTSVDVRASYANSKRDAPYELSLQYNRTNTAGDPYGDMFVNRLDGGGQGDATVSFSKLDEDVWSAGADVSHQFGSGWSGTVGYAYQYNIRDNSRRAFEWRATGSANYISAFGVLRPDVLLQPEMFYLADQGVNYSILFNEIDFGGSVFEAKLLNHAAYGKVNGRLSNALTFDLGVRWEYAKETSENISVVANAGPTFPMVELKNEYFLPALTLTYEIQPGMQVRASASKTIARPQFRELLPQTFFDPESNREYRGNPYLRDSKLTNAEARYEWYVSRDDRLAVGGFYKKLDKPIESFLTGSEDFITSYANAPEATLFGAEFELQKYFDAFATRRVLVSANYTFTKSELKVAADDFTYVYGASALGSDGLALATDYFRDGDPLTGQSKHILNVQLGLEDTDGLSQQTILFNYASKRVVSRGLVNSGQPDIYENPGLRIDFVARQGVRLFNQDLELKFEARNLTGQDHEEYQNFENGRVDVNTYDVGRTFSASMAVKF